MTLRLHRPHHHHNHRNRHYNLQPPPSGV